MSHLKSLKLTAAVPARASADPVVRSREKMIAALVEQKQMAEAKIAGQVPLTSQRRACHRLPHLSRSPGDFGQRLIRAAKP